MGPVVGSFTSARVAARNPAGHLAYFTHDDQLRRRGPPSRQAGSRFQLSLRQGAELRARLLDPMNPRSTGRPCRGTATCRRRRLKLGGLVSAASWTRCSAASLKRGVSAAGRAVTFRPGCKYATGCMCPLHTYGNGPGMLPHGPLHIPPLPSGDLQGVFVHSCSITAVHMRQLGELF